MHGIQKGGAVGGAHIAEWACNSIAIEGAVAVELARLLEQRVVHLREQGNRNRRLTRFRDGVRNGDSRPTHSLDSLDQIPYCRVDPSCAYGSKGAYGSLAFTQYCHHQ